jgi:hypothetical protein
MRAIVVRPRRYTGRGIRRRQGFMAESYVEVPRYLNRSPSDLREVYRDYSLPG